MVAKKTNLFNTIFLRNFQLSDLDLRISEYFTHNVASPKNNNLATASSNGWDAYIVESNHIASIGNVMYTIYIIWLLQAVLILLLAMVGSIVITIKPNSSIADEPMKLPSNVRFYSTTENKTLHPNWITGFSDVEASFSVSISKAKNTKTGFQVIPTFAIELHYRDIDLLYRIKEFFGVGNVYLIENKGHAVFVVVSINDLLNVIIPHYANYSLLTIKRVNFLLFKEILELMGKKKHLTEEGIAKIKIIKSGMNTGRKEKAKVGAKVITIKPNSSINNGKSDSSYNTIGSDSSYGEADQNITLENNNQSYARANKNIILESNSWWAVLTALFLLMGNLVWFVCHPESLVLPNLIQGMVNTLEAISNLVTNNEISKETAQLFLDALNQLYNELPVIIDFLRNITINHKPIFDVLADSLQNVVLPMIEQLIKIIIEYIRSR